MTGVRTAVMRLAVHAFPRRWRAVNGAEFLVTAEALAADGAARALPIEFIDTVLAGFDVRLRTRPPLRYRVPYRLLNRPVPRQWHGWMRDDLQSRWVGLRTLGWILLPLLGWFWYLALTTGGLGPPWWVSGFYAVVMILGTPIKSRQIRRQVHRKAGLAEDGSSLPPPAKPTPTS